MVFLNNEGVRKIFDDVGDYLRGRMEAGKLPVTTAIDYQLILRRKEREVLKRLEERPLSYRATVILSDKRGIMVQVNDGIHVLPNTSLMPDFSRFVSLEEEKRAEKINAREERFERVWTKPIARVKLPNFIARLIL